MSDKPARWSDYRPGAPYWGDPELLMFARWVVRCFRRHLDAAGVSRDAAKKESA